jgi:putative phosphoesterase
MDGRKLLVLSDTHGSVKTLKNVLSWAQAQTVSGDTIRTAVFLGDGVSDLRPATDAAEFSCDWIVISGNNDYDYYSIPDTSIFDFNGHRFYISHGFRHTLYGGYNTLVAAARKNNADAALFGHTHVPFCKNIGGILLLNPGSIGRPRNKVGASFAVINCIPGKPLEANFWGINFRGEISKIELHL